MAKKTSFQELCKSCYRLRKEGLSFDDISEKLNSSNELSENMIKLAIEESSRFEKEEAKRTLKSREKRIFFNMGMLLISVFFVYMLFTYMRNDSENLLFLYIGLAGSGLIILIYFFLVRKMQE
jgi:orotate phosphoribosyltransferase-like protein